MHLLLDDSLEAISQSVMMDAPKPDPIPSSLRPRYLLVMMFLWSVAEIYFQASQYQAECGGEVLLWFERGESGRGSLWRRRRRGFKRLPCFSSTSKHLVCSPIV